MNTEVSILGLKLETVGRRRALVVLVYLSYLLVLAPFWLAHHADKRLLALALPAFLLWAAGFWALSQVSRAYSFPTGSSPDRADERQAQVRDRAFVHAYQIFSSFVCFAVLYWMIASDFGWPLPGQSSVQAVFFAVILLSATLPSSVVTWTEPDEPSSSLPGHAPHERYTEV